eukprot:3282121-Amphidinium_carterae.1
MGRKFRQKRSVRSERLRTYSESLAVRQLSSVSRERNTDFTSCPFLMVLQRSIRVFASLSSTTPRRVHPIVYGRTHIQLVVMMIVS